VPLYVVNVLRVFQHARRMIVEILYTRQSLIYLGNVQGVLVLGCLAHFMRFFVIA